ncbi:MAG: MBL fold metallo-hydrolase [Candidatus Izemoplasmatales bacterium]|nr:MBL fold metallo-hydrolase [Candidatus Izemoplasmatales bacterium]
MINITKYSSKNMDVNTYILAKENQALVIDPGFNGKTVINHCENHNLKIKAVVLTHGHYDHIRDLTLLINNNVLKIYIYIDESDFLYNPNLNLSLMFKDNIILSKEIKVTKVEDGQIIEFNKENLKVIHLPGHTKGSIGLLYNQHFFSGDTLFYDSIGRTDLPTGNSGKIFISLKKIKTTLSKNTIVYPGHGKGGRLLDILKTNPYFSNLN